MTEQLYERQSRVEAVSVHLGALIVVSLADIQNSTDILTIDIKYRIHLLYHPLICQRTLHYNSVYSLKQLKLLKGQGRNVEMGLKLTPEVGGLVVVV